MNKQSILTKKDSNTILIMQNYIKILKKSRPNKEQEAKEVKEEQVMSML